MNLLTNEFLFNKKNNPAIYKNFSAVYFAIPVVAYRVSYVKHVNPDNIVERTIFGLKKIGYSTKKIADTICLDKRLVNSVLEYYAQATTTEGKTDTKDCVKNDYIFYDCYRGKFFGEYMDENDFAENTELYLVDRRKATFKFKKNFSDSRDYCVHILYDEGKEPPAAPSQEDIISVIGKSRREEISDKHYSNGEYLNERRELYLICTAYLDENDFTDISVANPIFGEKANYLKRAMDKAVEAFPQKNEALKKDIERLKVRAFDEADAVCDELSDSDKKIADLLLKRYGKAVTLYKPVYSRLIELEKSFQAYDSAIHQKVSAADCMNEQAKFQSAAHNLLEQVFIQSYYKHASDETILTYGKVTKNNSKPELLLAYMHNLGFHCGDSANAFLKGVIIDELRQVFESTEKPNYIRERINLWVAANVMCGTVDKNHPIHELARRAPNLIDALTVSLGMRNKATHDSNKAVIVDFDKVKQMYDYCKMVTAIMLGIKVINADIAKSSTNGREVRQKIEMLARDRLKNFRFNDPVIENRAEKMSISYFGRSGSFYSDCYNFLNSVYLNVLAKYYDDDLCERLVATLPEDKNALRSYMTETVKAGGADYEIKSVINKAKLTGFTDLERATLTCIEFLTILFVQEKDPLAFGRYGFKELLQLTDSVVEKRQHSALTDFNKDGDECKQLLDGLLNLINENQGE